MRNIGRTNQMGVLGFKSGTLLGTLLLVGGLANSEIAAGLDALEIKLTASDGAAGDSFGKSVAVSGRTALVGARFDDDAGRVSGSAYLFQDTSAAGDWSSFTETKLNASDGAAMDSFGNSVSISGRTALGGAAFDDNDGGRNSGSAYVFVLLQGPADFVIDIISDVIALNLQHGIENSFVAKLEAAVFVLNDLIPNNDVAAINALEAFINAVLSQQGVNILEADADLLIVDAQEIIALLGGE